MPRPSRAAEIDDALLRTLVAHPRDLARCVAEIINVSRQTVLSRIHALITQGYIEKTSGTRPIYLPGKYRKAAFSYQRIGLAEDIVWTRDVRPLLGGVPPNVYEICQHGLTEMVNNVVDHSEAKNVNVLIDVDVESVFFKIHDDGIGIFHKISRHLNLPDERLALLELSKGKFTTDPSQHSGEGVFFTSRMFDLFQIISSGLVFNHASDTQDDTLFEADENISGTTVFMRISRVSEQTVASVFAEFSSGPDDHDFAKTIVPVHLARIGEDNLVSRSQAKRLLARVNRFRTVVLDFSGVDTIGQAFADEVFRVFVNAHPGTELIPVNTTTAVQQMIRRAENSRNLPFD